MGKYLEFTGDQGPVLVEVSAATSTATTRGGRVADELIHAGESLEQILAKVGPTVAGLVGSLRSADSSPQHVEIEFSIKLSADAKVIIASTKAEANFRVLLKWNEEKA